MATIFFSPNLLCFLKIILNPYQPLGAVQSMVGDPVGPGQKADNLV